MHTAKVTKAALCWQEILSCCTPTMELSLQKASNNVYGSPGTEQSIATNTMDEEEQPNTAYSEEQTWRTCF